MSYSLLLAEQKLRAIRYCIIVIIFVPFSIYFSFYLATVEAALNYISADELRADSQKLAPVNRYFRSMYLICLYLKRTMRYCQRLGETACVDMKKFQCFVISLLLEKICTSNSSKLLKGSLFNKG